MNLYSNKGKCQELWLTECKDTNTDNNALQNFKTFY